MTCHDRRDLTLACLESLRDQSFFQPRDLYLVDDGSTDGTGDAVRAAMPGAQVIAGDGSLFWNGGMRKAWTAAKRDETDYDFYLWLNDDVLLAPDALAMLVADADATVPRGRAVIVSGACHEPGNPNEITYGAQRRPDKKRQFRLELVEPGGTPREAVSVSGNVVLVSRAAERRLGNLTPKLTHIYGDLDYGFRAVDAGVPVVLASRVAGSCPANPDTGTSQEADLSRATRLKRLRRERAALHGRDWNTFVAMHGNLFERIGHRVAPYIRALRAQR